MLVTLTNFIRYIKQNQVSNQNNSFDFLNFTSVYQTLDFNFFIQISS